MEKAALHYAKRLSELNIEQKRLARISQYFFVLRLVLFASLIVNLIWIINTNGERMLTWYLGAALVTGFLLIIKLNHTLNVKRNRIQNLVDINKNEQKYIDYQYLSFDGGDRFVDLNPKYASDFEIFGKGSLYQYLNRSVTFAGTKRLAQKLCHWDLDSKTIEQKQQAVAELSNHHQFMEAFQSLGLVSKASGYDADNLKKWFGAANTIKSKEKMLLIAYPLLFAIITLLVVASLVNASVYIFSIVVALLVLSRYKKYVDEAHDKLGKSAKVFEVYSALVRLIENEPFQSPYLKSLQSKLAGEEQKASTSIKRLFLLLNRFDYRYNFLVNILFNTSTLFELQVLQQLERWKDQHQQKAFEWFDALAEMDALIGFGRFAFNNTVATYPKVKAHPFGIQASSLGHPLISTSKRVDNNFDCTGKPKVVVVTGANMAGKSTFLRTIAANLILAHNGAPVCANDFTFTPCSIVSSINIHDSLANNESYFYAELKRINQIIEQVSENPKTLVFFDEILRGTNPNDKQLGSIGLTKKLIKLNTFTIIATHDLAIGDLEKEYPNIVTNKCFEVEIEGDRLIFDYKLKEGVSKKLNASFLMRKMNIID